MPLNIAHLSDIHFTCDSRLVGHDPNESMRHYMLDDLHDQTHKYGPLDALIISGDIAYGGRPAEFIKAREWISQICRIGGIGDDAVFVSPGNHDIDRAVLLQRSSIEDTHLALRQISDNDQRNAQMLRRLALDETKRLLYAPLENFNDFALAYNGCFYPEGKQYAWTRPLTLDDGSVLRIRGLNTAILCGMKDAKGSLFLGESAWDITREAGVEYLAFSHHPPSWLLDGAEMAAHFGDTVRIQLYGHEHDQRIVRGADTVVLFAGAVNPHKDKDWCPGYNFIRISVGKNEKQHREMRVTIHAREWQNKSPRQFKAYAGNAPDGSHEACFQLRPWNPPAMAAVSHTNAETPELTRQQSPSYPSATPNTPALQISDVMHPLFDLDRVRQKEILERLTLISEADDAYPHFMILTKALERAFANGKLVQLADALAMERKNGN